MVFDPCFFYRQLDEALVYQSAAVAVAKSEAASLEPWVVRAGEAGTLVKVQAVWVAPTYVPGSYLPRCPSALIGSHIFLPKLGG